MQNHSVNKSYENWSFICPGKSLTEIKKEPGQEGNTKYNEYNI